MLDIRKLTKHIGAEVGGVDLREPLPVEMFQRLRMALAKYAVLVFRGQEITNEQHIHFSAGLGPLEMTIPSDPIGDGGPLGVISNVDEQGQIIPPDDVRSLYTKGNMLWHSDGSFKPVPLRASLLLAKAIPPTGGNTEFASLVASYEALPAAQRQRLEGLFAEHSLAHSRAQIAPNLMPDRFLKDTPPVSQPMLRPIPETGKRALLVGAYATHVVDQPLPEGRALLAELLAWVTRPEFVYRHQWQINDLLVYDNRCCLHRGRDWDRATYKRILHRTTLAGDDPTRSSAPPQPLT
ncbi:MAG: TauD/TfdA family dioxygenase [Planctomycetota bacterium]|nr:TauD/TfdA family dioxygenase [Planctomycetota bacterium]